MKGLILLLFLIVFVTTFPNGTTQVIGGGLVPTSTTSAIRFFGESWVRYDFRDTPGDMVAPATNETLSFQFLTQDNDGMMWLFNGDNGKRVHLSIQNGALLFVIHHDGNSNSPQRIVLRDPQGGSYSDTKWYTFRVEKKGRNLKFYINNQYIEEVTAITDVQFVDRGDFYLGGSPRTSSYTDRLVLSNFNGGITDLEVRKLTAPLREIIVRFLQLVNAAETTGKVEIIPRDKLPTYIWFPKVTTPTPELPTPVTFTSASSAFYLSEPLDMSQRGSLSFEFRTLEPRGLLAIARGTQAYFAIEIFDGILYFVYDFGSFSRREVFSARRVDDGEWHEVKLRIDGRRMTISLDGRDIPMSLSSSDKKGFERLYVGGFDNIANVPWSLYSRIGYKGCLKSLKVNGIGVDLHSRFRDARVRGVEVGCRPMARFCQTQPCDKGVCKDVIDNFECYCPNTYFTGQKCDTRAYTLSMDGTTSANYQFLTRESTHTNDMSIRFLTPLADTLLFTTEADNEDDFIRAELVDGTVKVSLRVDGKTKVINTGKDLNDYRWHTLFIRRRANTVEVWVDDENKIASVLAGEGYKLVIDRIKFGSMGSTSSLSSNKYIGLMQNFIYDKTDVFSQLRPKTLSKLIWISGVSPNYVPIPVYKPITVTSSKTFFRLPGMRIGRTMKLMFKFRTREANGLILYNKGVGNDALAVEMSNGQIRLAYNLGGRNMFSVVPTVSKLNDNNWHTVIITLNEDGQFSVKVDDENLDVSTSDGDGRLTLTGNPLFIAGLPQSMFNQREVTSFIESRKGFRGCIASMDLNGAVPELLSGPYANDKQLIANGCTDLAVACKPGVCGPGTCVPLVEEYLCDCNMTGYVGIPCKEEPIGYYFGKNDGKGIVIYSYPHEKMGSSDRDRIAFGFMTERENGVLYRMESALNAKEYIEIRLEDGYVIAESNTGGGIVTVSERSRKFNDGQYHTVSYIRTGVNSTLQVNSIPAHTAVNTGVVSLFDKIHTVILGGRTNAKGQQINNFNGIIGGAYYNGIRWFDLLFGGQQLHGKLVQMRGDVVLTKPFILSKSIPTPKPTAGPPPIFIAPDTPIPTDIGGSGFAVNPPSGTGGGGGGVLGVGDAGGINTIPEAVGINVAGSPNVAAASTLLGPGPPPLATGARAGVVVGTLLGTLAFLSSLMWALYKLKPGVPSVFSPGAGAAGAGGDGMVISAPRTTSNLAAVQAASGGGGGGAGGAGAGKVTVVNGAAAGGGGAGGGSSTYTSYFQSTSTSVGGGGAGGAGGAGASAGGGDQFDSATLRATGTFSNKGTTIGTPGAVRSNMGSSSSYSANYQTNTLQSTQSYGSGQASPGVGGGMSSGSYSDRQYLASGDNIPDYDLPVAGTMQSGHSYSSSTLNTHYNYQANHSNIQNQHHKSVLNILLTGNRPSSPVPIRHEIYTPALAASGDQAYVDRAEDIVIEQPRACVFVKPTLLIEDTDAGTTSSVTLKTGMSAQASYSSKSNNNTYSSIQDVSTTSRQSTGTSGYTNIDTPALTTDMFSGNRKASLQVFPKSGKGAYQRLENSSSESNVSILTGNTSSRKSKNLNVSHDNMYESTTTVTSSLFSESMDTSLSNLEEETSFGANPQSLDSLLADFANFKTDFSADLGEFSVDTQTDDSIYAKVDKSKKTSSANSKQDSAIEMKDLVSSEANRVDVSQTQQQSSLSINNQAGGNQTDRAETVIEFQRPTFSKQTSKTSSSSIMINVPGDGKDLASSGSYQVSELSSQTSTISKRSHTTSSSSESTTMVVSLEGETKSTGNVGNGRDLDAELDSSMNTLLTGIDVDTSKWDALKDSRGSIGAMPSDDWEVQNLKTVTINRQGQYVMSGGAVTPGAAADEVRVDCCLITGDGTHVVTGSSLGPPQVWDMQSGELQNIMKGDTVGSTGLHLVCGDRLLVGAVHADMEINEYSGRKGVFNHHLQIWDFVTGKPLSMAEGEYCSALCPMSDNDKVMFARTDKFGDATSIIAWDLMGNQMIKEMRYDAPLGNNDYISYLNLSKNDRFVVAGYTNSFDNCAEFMTFDMTLTSYMINEPALLKLDANPDCTAILPKEEAVTGLRNGDLVIWSLRSAQPSRQLLGSGGAHAHSREVKTVTLSKDSKYLVSGAADGTLKVWDLHTERPVHTLNGHTDEVWCSAISDDNEIVVSGSNDGTIRLWRMKNGSEMCVFNCGVDIFFVTMSRDKGTIVALGDKFGARKLIMLQVVRTKIKKIVSS